MNAHDFSLSDTNRKIGNWIGVGPAVLWVVQDPVDGGICYSSPSKRQTEEWFQFHLDSMPNSRFKDYKVKTFEVYPDFLGLNNAGTAPHQWISWALTQLSWCQVIAPQSEDGADALWTVTTIDGAHPFKVSAQGSSLPIALYLAMESFVRFKEQGPAYL